MTLKNTLARLVLTPFLMVFLLPAGAQMITGVWKGKINRQKVEVKIIQQGDSLLGTSYYYESANNYRRYSIRGYFDATTNQAVWWDDQLIDEKSGRLSLSAPGKNAMLSSADFNCPGSGKMLLDGKTGPADDERPPRGDVNLEKVPDPVFEDEWDFVIDNYTVGANDPDIIDSIAAIAGQRPTRDEPVRTIPREDPVAATRPPVTNQPVTPIEAPREQPKPVVTITEPVRPQTIEEKFTSRKKMLTTEIPLSGDSIELRFYDNAEIDGDSISLFLNEKLVFSHIRLTGNAYSIKLAVSELQSTNELIMVAENLGSIPPNTSYMVAIVNQQRYEARLESTEGSSAMVRFVKK
jgi:hypothetical protein